MTHGTLSWACQECLSGFLGVAGLKWGMGRSHHSHKCAWKVTVVRMSLSTGCGSFKAWALEIALLCGFAGEEVMKQHRLLFIFFHSWCAVVAKEWSVMDIGASHPRRLLF